MERPLRLTALLVLLGWLLLLSGCGGSGVASTLDVRPTGSDGETLTWTANADATGPWHLLRVGIETDAAKLMGWSRTDVGYRAILDVSVTDAKGRTDREILIVPITEKREVGREGDTVLMSYSAAGVMQETGFGRVPAVDAVRFKPSPGEHRIDLQIRTPSGGNRKSLKAIRSVRVEVVSRTEADGVLTDWTLVETPK